MLFAVLDILPNIVALTFVFNYKIFIFNICYLSLSIHDGPTSVSVPSNNIKLHRVLKKRANLFICTVSVKCKPISIKIGSHVVEQRFNKTVHAVPTSPKYKL